MKRAPFLAIAAAWALCACGAKPEAGPADGPRRVLLLQIDGLTPRLLEAYLGRAASRDAGHALHRVLGASAPGGGGSSSPGPCGRRCWRRCRRTVTRRRRP